ncbi:MAG: ABC transporter permease subunit [Spirochaetales bacterium]|jgi:ABC-2 type transport system permease protein|nr:ABC transporter permease subunit [Spirochaetales bacterium]
MIAILKREIKSYFLSPIGYIYMGFFLLAAGIFFLFSNLFSQSSGFTGFLGSILFIYLFAIPLLTMRLFSEERRQRTDQLLLTSPVTVGEIVLGKFFAAVAVYLMTLLVTLMYVVVIVIFGDLAVWETVGSYIGFAFLGASYIAVGVFISAGTDNQLTAALVTFFSLMMIWLIDPISQSVPADLQSGVISAAALALALCVFIYVNTRNLYVVIGAALLGALVITALYFINQDIYLGFIRKFLAWFSLNKRYQNFSMGILKVDSLVYYICFSGLFLFLTVRLIEKRRWN